ncbi:2-aminobenzoate-CoA ligase [Streptomyces agglomeratus]|uniref:2-aminobenzoate-CoA ligase n=1 Tax=Streptomyces agglomeratus TaxID=285458 RepID=A0A1E5P4R2_9ACTN|nr:AMP-binding protein [Streptomyces agglomeratus]OEJ24540.1 2-aminobenzoate-CoA ligase [Streptomyces agglomeratus]OEJ41507.1 2-aminobenzoate-CoA ligase [Streptomyces agglomeratus]OEJ44114.1 2-aminobenzoate-CoA ligase [Streptomyces agglomeratus]OEJ53998.1 2-aminobenzoate-CoA ligase [Streptomyces agglomeratus]OEJ61371.1 2-aminobenzoate-CoA ligase [Streptomyces agglomeratus]
MELKTSAHIDTFPRDQLPPAHQWPQLLFDRPELRYPDRLNCGVELLDRTVERLGPDRPVFRTAAGEVWTYGELLGHVDRIAHVLTTDLGVVPGNRVLLRGPTTPWLAACWLAVMKAGAVAVTVLAQQRASELATMCEIARVGHALCDVRAVDDLVKAEVPGLRVTAYGGDAPDDLLRAAAGKPSRYTAVRTSADDVALIAFTSGTTGRPKGCMHFHRDVLAVADTFSRHVLRPRADDVFAGSPPLGFTFGLGGLVIFPMRAGASALLLEQAGPKQLLPALAEHRVSVLFTAPTAYRAMLEGLDGHDLSALRRCVSAGENLPAATWRAWHERTGVRIINGIGATELLHIFLSAADEAARPGTTGVPVPGWEARVVDASGAPVPDGEPGFLAVRGPVGCRYLADDRQTEYARGGWNLTGDTYVREPDGYFRYVARADDMIISAGYNIAGPEVEDALLRHPDVVEAAVVGRTDERRGQVVVAYVVLGDGVAAGDATVARLRDFVKAELAPYKCPREIVFLDALPRTPTGKLQRFRLRAAAE